MSYSESNLKRRVEIENTLLQLMKEQSFDTITVKDMAQRLQLARKTFYSYFPSKHACLDSLTDRLIYECTLELLQGITGQRNMAQFFRIWTEFWLKNRVFLEALRANRMGDYLIQRLMRYITQEHPDTLKLLNTTQLTCDEDILYFCISGEVALLMKWCHEGFSLPLEEMVAKQLRLSGLPLIHPGQ